VSEDPLIPDCIGDGYIAKTVYPGHCAVPGCHNEALTICQQHEAAIRLIEATESLCGYAWTELQQCDGELIRRIRVAGDAASESARLLRGGTARG